MAQQIVNIGIAPNTNTGDPIRTAFTKINDNFTELYSFAIPSQTGNNGKFLTTDGATLSWANVTLPSGQTAGSATPGYLQYNGTIKAAGQLDGGTVDPNSTTRLNFDGYLYATRFYGNGGNLTNLTAGNLTGTIPSAVLGNSSFNIGTTSIALNRSSGVQSLTGVSIDGNAGTVTNGVYTTGSYADPAWITSLDKAKVGLGNVLNVAQEPAITAGTTSQYWRGDKSWQTLNSAAVGLGNVENTALSTWAGSTNITTIGAATATSLSVTGNLTVNGTTTTVNSTTVTIDDPILTLGGDTAPTTNDNKDRGIEFRWHNGTSAKTGFFGFDDSTGYFTFVPDATNTSEVFSGTPGILDVGGIVINSGTANGVLYLNGSKVATSGSALTFDGTTFKASRAGTPFILAENTASAAAAVVQVKNTAGSTYLGQDSTGGYLLTDYAAPLLFYINNTEQMRLTSTGLGIGTSSPGGKLDVKQTTDTSLGGIYVRATDSNAAVISRLTTGNLVVRNGGIDSLFLDSSGNLGLGVTPSAWGAGSQALQNGGGAVFQYNNDRIFLGQNTYIDSAFGDRFIGNGYATRYRQYQGTHAFYVSTVSNSSGAGASQSLTQAMTLDESGNLLLGGTSNPANARMISENTSGNQLGLRYTGVATYYNSVDSGGNLIWTKDGSERARIDSDGNFVVGATSAWGKFHVTRSVNNGNSAATNVTDYQNAVAILHNQDNAGTGNKFGLMFAFAGSPGILAGIDAYKESGNWNTGLRFYTNNQTGGPSTGTITERIRLTPAGNFVIDSAGALWTNTVRNTAGDWLVGKTGTEISLGSSSATNEIRFNSAANAAFEYRSQPILHSGNYNSYSPTLTGNGASGTWSISVTGNAATATSANNIDGVAFNNSNSGNPVSAPDSLDSNGIGYVTSISLLGQTDGALYSQAYSSSWQHQIYGDYRTGQIAVRGRNSGTWQAWRTVLDSSNYSSYALPLSGGTVTGALNLDSGIGFRRGSGDYGTYIKSSGYPGQGYANTDGNRYWVELGGAGGVHVVLNTDGGASGAENTYDHFTIWQGSNEGTRLHWTTNAGHTTSAGSSRAPIFYDSADTDYYIDANSYSRLNRLVVNQARVDSSRYPIGHYSSGEAVFDIDPTWTNDQLQAYFNSSSVSWVADSTAPGGYAISIVGAVNVGGFNTSGFPYIPVDSGDTFYMEVWIRNVTGTNTHYMGSQDFNHNFSSLGGNPGSYGYWVMSNSNPGTSWTKYSGYISGFGTSTGQFVSGTEYWIPQALFNYTGGGTTYISGWKVIKVSHAGNRNFAGQVVIGGNYTNNAYSSTSGTRLMFGGGDANAQGSYYIGTNLENYGGNYNKLDIRWHTGIRMGAQPNYGGIRFYDTENLGTQIFAIGKDGSYAQANQSMRAPIFYDLDDTSYYVDANSNSRLVNLGLGGVTPDVRLSVSGDAHISGVLYMGGTAGSLSSWGSRDYTTSGNRYFNASTYEFNNYGYGSNWNFYVNSSEARHTSSVRAPIFYDSNDTNYYVDPASISRLENLLMFSAISNNVNGLRNLVPGGGSYVTGSSSVSGAIRITLPELSYPMLRFTVKVYTYDGLSFEINCGGHTSGEAWYNTFAYMSTQSRSALNVRFSTSSGTAYVYIGELGSTWSYPQIFITDVQVGYSNYEYNRWDNNWVVGFDTSSYNTVHSTHVVYPPTFSSNNTNPSYASIFYDSNDTTYYLDPNSTSNSALRIRGGALHGPNPTWGAYLYVGTDGRVDSTIASVATTNGNLHLDSKNGNQLYLNWYSTENIYSKGNFGVGSDSASYRLHVHGTGYATSDFRSPIFYDSDDTTYYIDPASSSVLNANLTTSDYYARGWFRNNNSGQGLYNQATGNHWYSDSANYWNMGGGANGSGIRFRDNHAGTIRGYVYYDQSNNIGFLNQDGSWRARVVGGDYWLVDGSSARAQLFYDSNDTSYYVDPASTSVMNRISTVRTNDWLYMDNNYGHSVVGVYSSYRLQGVFAMGSDYRMAADGTATNNMYGIAWSHPNAGSLGGANNLNDHGILIINGGSFRAAISSRAVFSADVRGTLFYDYNDTNYYVDPASTSYINNLYMVGGIASPWNSASYSDAAIEVRERGFGNAQDDTWATAPRIGFHWGGRVASQIGMASNGRIHILNNPGNGNEALESGNFYAPIFYDSNNTGYYVDPSSTTYLHTLTLSGANYFRPQNWIQLDSTYGLYWPNHYGTHLHANDLSTYTQIALRGGKNSYGGIYDQYSAVNGMMYDSSGNGGVYREANGRWYTYYHLGNDCLSVGTSTTNSSYGIYCGKGLYAGGRVDGTIFYDANDTGYYIDPNSTTALRTVGSWRADSASWDGEFNGKIQYHASHWYFQGAGEWYFRNSGGSAVLSCTQGGNLTAAGNVTAYSDIRLKKNVETIKNPLDIVSRLRGVTFDWIETNEHSYGLIAQEVEEVLPELVVENKPDPNSVDKDKPTIKSVDYSKMVSVLIEATKEQQKIIDAQEERINRLEKLVEKLTQ